MVGDGRALKLVLRPGHGGPEMYTLSWPLSGGWDPEESPLSSHWLDQKSDAISRGLSFPFFKTAITVILTCRVHAQQGAWQTANALPLSAAVMMVPLGHVSAGLGLPHCFLFMFGIDPPSAAIESCPLPSPALRESPHMVQGSGRSQIVQILGKFWV